MALTVVACPLESSLLQRARTLSWGPGPQRRVAPGRLDGEHLPAQPRHRARRGGGVLRRPLAAAADLRAGGLDRLRLRPASAAARSTRCATPSCRPLQPGADAADRRQHHPAHAQRGAPRRPLRRGVDRLRPGAVVGLAGAERLRRHHHDHVRPRRPPRHRPHPGAVVPALRARHAHRRRHDPARGRGPDAGPRVAARRGSRSSTASTGRRCCCSAIFFLATLYHVSVPVRTRWRYNLPGAAFTMFCWVLRLGHPAPRPGRHGARTRPRSTARWPPRSRCCCGCTCSRSPCSSAPPSTPRSTSCGRRRSSPRPVSSACAASRSTTCCPGGPRRSRPGGPRGDSVEAVRTGGSSLG